MREEQPVEELQIFDVQSGARNLGSRGRIQKVRKGDLGRRGVGIGCHEGEIVLHLGFVLFNPRVQVQHVC